MVEQQQSAVVEPGVEDPGVVEQQQINTTATTATTDTTDTTATTTRQLQQQQQLDQQLDELFGKDDEDLPTCISQIEMQADNVNNNANDNDFSSEEEEEDEEEEEEEEVEEEEASQSSSSVTESQAIEEINLSDEEEVATAVADLLQVIIPRPHAMACHASMPCLNVMPQ